MSSERRKTAFKFHAKDDLPEVRREVFHLILQHDLRFYAVIRDKNMIAGKVLKHNQSHPNYRYHPNQLYDRCVPQLFKDRLHQEDAYRIVFAKRGSSDRTESFERGLQQAKDRFRRKHGIESASPIEVVASDPEKIICLQAIDYMLWALQRSMEREEHRFIELVWPKVGLIIDRDDTRENEAGEYNSQRRSLLERTKK